MRDSASDEPAAAVNLPDEAARDDPRAGLLLMIGRAYHQAGTPSDMLEEVVTEIGACLGLEAQVNALPTSMMVTVGPARRQRVYMLRLKPGVTNFQRLARLNDLSNRLHAKTIGVAEAIEFMHAFDAEPRITPVALLTLAYACESFGFAALLGAGVNEALVSTALGVLIGLLATLADRVRTINRLFEVLAAFITTAIVTFAQLSDPSLAAYIPLLAGVVQLLPGYSLTTALLELADRNPVSGTARLGAALLVILSLTCGAAMAITLFGGQAFTSMTRPPHPLPPPFLALGVLSIAFAQTVILKGRLKDSPYVILSCAVSVVTTTLLAAVANPQVVAFGTALIVALLSNFGARFFRVPQAVLLIPGILVLVPGALGYRGFLLIFERRTTDGLTMAITAGISALLIVAGILFAQLLLPPRKRFAA